MNLEEKDKIFILALDNFVKRTIVIEQGCQMIKDTEKLETLDSKPEQPKCKTCGDTKEVPKPDRIGRPLQYQSIPCPDCLERPNQNLMIIDEIEGLMSQVNDKLNALRLKAFNISTEGQLKDNKHHLAAQATEEIDISRKATLFELRRAFE